MTKARDLLRGDAFPVMVPLRVLSVTPLETSDPDEQRWLHDNEDSDGYG